MSSQVPGFREEIEAGRYIARIGGTTLSHAEMAFPVDGSKTIRIHPAPKNAGIGILIAVGLGAVVAIGLAATLLARPSVPDPNLREDESQNTGVYDGVVNVQEQGHPRALIYGRCRVGSVVGSSGITTGTVPYNASVGTGAFFTPGAGGGGGFNPFSENLSLQKGGKSSGGSEGATEEPNSLQSNATARIIDILGEGEILGLVDGLASVYLDGTPVRNADDTFNFKGITMHERVGTPDQTFMPGFTAAESTREIAREARVDTGPVVETIADPDINVARVTIRLNALSQQNTENGNITGSSVQFALDLQSNGGGFTTVVNRTISGKQNGPYQESFDIRLPAGGAPWSVRMRRITPDNDESTIQDATFFDLLTEVVEAKLTYPNCAMVGLQVDAQQFGSSIPSRGYEVFGRIIRVPSNYDPETRTYTGIWDGSFKRAYSNNSAWVIYDIMTNKRFGLGRFLDDTSINKWEMYSIGQYCDEMVDDGRGGLEPRYTFNGAIATRQAAKDLLQSIASSFRSAIYWGSAQVVLTQDRPKDPLHIVTRANVEDGDFVYSGSANDEKYSAFLGWWNDPDDEYRLSPVVSRDNDLVLTLGWKPLETTFVGVTSPGHARRLTEYIKEDQATASDSLSYGTSFNQAGLVPGDIIEQFDQERTTVDWSGRIASATAGQVTLDRDVIASLVPGVSYRLTWLDVTGSPITGDIDAQASIASGDIHSAQLTEENLPPAGSPWIIRSTTLAPRQWMVRGNSEGDGISHQIQAVSYDPGKHARVESGINVDQVPWLDIPTGPVVAPGELTVTEYIQTEGNSVNMSLLMSWLPSGDPRVTSYDVQVRRPGQEWAGLTSSPETSRELREIEPGDYVFRVRSVSSFGQRSPWRQLEQELVGQTSPLLQIENIVILQDRQALQSYLSWDVPDDQRPLQYEVFFSAGTGFAQATMFETAQTNRHIITRAGNYWVRAIFMDQRGPEGDPVAVEKDDLPLPEYADIISAPTNLRDLDPAARELLDAAGSALSNITNFSESIEVVRTDLQEDIDAALEAAGDAQEDADALGNEVANVRAALRHGVNIFPNPSGDASGDPASDAGWQIFGGDANTPALSQGANIGRGGQQYEAVFSGGYNAAGAVQYFFEVETTRAGTYTLSATARATSALSGLVSLRLQARNASGGLGTVQVQISALERYSVTLDAPAGVERLRVALVVPAVSFAEFALFHAAQIKLEIGEVATVFSDDATGLGISERISDLTETQIADQQASAQRLNALELFAGTGPDAPFATFGDLTAAFIDLDDDAIRITDLSFLQGQIDDPTTGLGLMAQDIASNSIQLDDLDEDLLAQAGRLDVIEVGARGGVNIFPNPSGDASGDLASDAGWQIFNDNAQTPPLRQGGNDARGGRQYEAVFSGGYDNSGAVQYFFEVETTRSGFWTLGALAAATNDLNGNIQLRLQARSASGSLGTVQVTVGVLDRYSVTIDAPSGVTILRVAVVVPATSFAGNALFYLSQIKLERGEIATAFSDDESLALANAAIIEERNASIGRDTAAADRLNLIELFVGDAEGTGFATYADLVNAFVDLETDAILITDLSFIRAELDDPNTDLGSLAQNVESNTVQLGDLDEGLIAQAGRLELVEVVARGGVNRFPNPSGDASGDLASDAGWGEIDVNGLAPALTQGNNLARGGQQYEAVFSGGYDNSATIQYFFDVETTRSGFWTVAALAAATNGLNGVVQLRIQARDENGSLGLVQVPLSNLDRYSVTIDAPSGVTILRVAVVVPATSFAGNALFYLSQIKLERGDVATAFSDDRSAIDINAAIIAERDARIGETGANANRLDAIDLEFTAEDGAISILAGAIDSVDVQINGPGGVDDQINGSGGIDDQINGNGGVVEVAGAAAQAVSDLSLAIGDTSARSGTINQALVDVEGRTRAFLESSVSATGPGGTSQAGLQLRALDEDGNPVAVASLLVEGGDGQLYGLIVDSATGVLTFLGQLRSNSSVLMNSGDTTGVQAALQIFYASDGETVSFGRTYDTTPEILADRGATHDSDVEARVTSVSTDEMTVSVKTVTSSPAQTYTGTNDSAGNSNQPDRVMAQFAPADVTTFDDIYELEITALINVTAIPDEASGGVSYSGQLRVTPAYRIGAPWIYVATQTLTLAQLGIAPNHQSGTQSYTAFNIRVTAFFPGDHRNSGATYGISAENADGAIINLVSVSFDGRSSAIESPAPGLARFILIPKG